MPTYIDNKNIEKNKIAAEEAVLPPIKDIEPVHRPDSKVQKNYCSRK